MNADDRLARAGNRLGDLLQFETIGVQSDCAHCILLASIFVERHYHDYVDAVFLPRLDEGELPIRRGDVDEERRLLYVGITRARKHLCLTWSGKPSRFLRELGERPRVEKRPESPVFDALKSWRLERARADEVPPYVVFHNTTLAENAERQPRTLAELALVPGVGPTKLARYGADVLRTLELHEQAA